MSAFVVERVDQLAGCARRCAAGTGRRPARRFRQLWLGNRHEARRRGRGHGRACLACLRRGLMGEVTGEELAAMTGTVGLRGKRVGPLYSVSRVEP